jgi:malate dehydrogenase
MQNSPQNTKTGKKINQCKPFVTLDFRVFLLDLGTDILIQKYTHMKITVVGAGAVGATCADNIARKELAQELVLLDIKEGFAEGKAMDMMQTATLLGFDTKITGSTNDYSKTANSDVVVITSGLPRKPGMTREELIGTNANIVKGVVENILKFSPNAIIVVISNPMDTMTYLALKSSGIPKNRIIGMGGILDSARFKYYLSQALNCSPNDLHGVVVGGHGDTTMIPLTRLAQLNGFAVSNLLDADTLKKVAADTMVGGATLTGLLGTSAWYAPGAAGAALVESIVRDEKKVFPCCVALDGEYGQKDICLGVPVVIGKNGWEKIIDYKLNDEEQAAFNKSAEAVRSMNAVLHDMKAI